MQLQRWGLLNYSPPMIRSCLVAASLCLAGLLVWNPRAAGPDDDYVSYFHTIQQADALRTKGQVELARNKYEEVLKGLQKLQKVYPTWQPRAVQFRINYVEEKLGREK